MGKVGEADVCMHVCMNLRAHVCAHPGTAARLLMVSGARTGESRHGPWKICSAVCVYVGQRKYLTLDGCSTLQPSLHGFSCQGHLGVTGDRRGKICGLLLLCSNQSNLFKQ